MILEMTTRPTPFRWSKKGIAWMLGISGTCTVWRWTCQAERDDDSAFDQQCKREGIRTKQPSNQIVLLLSEYVGRNPPDNRRQLRVIQHAEEKLLKYESYLMQRFGDNYIERDERKNYIPEFMKKGEDEPPQG